MHRDICSIAPLEAKAAARHLGGHRSSLTTMVMHQQGRDWHDPQLDHQQITSRLTTMRQAIDEATLRALISTHTVREFRATRRGDAWALEGRLGGYWLHVRSQREPVRRWASLTALGRFCEACGIRTLSVEF